MLTLRRDGDTDARADAEVEGRAAVVGASGEGVAVIGFGEGEDGIVISGQVGGRIVDTTVAAHSTARPLPIDQAGCCALLRVVV